MHHEPADHPQHHVDEHRTHPDLPQHPGDEQHAGRTGEPAQGQVVGVEHRDHRDRAEVVDDRQRQQEQPGSRRHARTDREDDCDGEGDVRGHRDTPATRGVGAGVEDRVDGRGHHHAAERGDDRQRCRTRVAELSEDELALDLERDDEEEDRHQAVVDDVAEGQVEWLPLPHPESHLGLPEVLVRVREPAVGEHHRNHHGHQDQDGGADLERHQALQWPHHPAGNEPVRLGPAVRDHLGVGWPGLLLALAHRSVLTAARVPCASRVSAPSASPDSAAATVICCGPIIGATRR